MSDRDIVSALRAKVGSDFDVQFRGDECVALSLHDHRHPFGGLVIRKV